MSTEHSINSVNQNNPVHEFAILKSKVNTKQFANC